MIKRENELKSMKLIFTTHFGTFGSNMFLALKIINYEDMY
jgi:hypothetical protein